jgi:hypothetical protein
MIRALVLMMLSLLATAAAAHPLAPALLELREIAPARYEVLWRTSVSRAQQQDVSPQLPAGCVELAAPQARIEDEALVARWTVQCPAAVAGQTIAIAGLEGSGITVILRVQERGGRVATALLTPQQSSIVAEAPGPTLARYFALGVRHLASGFDHVLFICGLVLLVRRPRALVVTVTAFTLGHSVTLALATLGLVKVDAALMELGIALSILVLATELARDAPSLLARRPWLLAAGFGLLHGLGFAGALAEAGIPAGEIAAALLGFNLGIEAAQLALVAALLLAIAALGRVRAPTVIWRTASIYAIGSLAGYWALGRAAALWAGTS